MMKNMKMKAVCGLLSGALVLSLLTGCGQAVAGSFEAGSVSEETTADGNGGDELFSKRDYDASYDEKSAAVITLNGDTAACDSDVVRISGSTITITDEGTYILSGTLSDGMVLVDAENTDKIQLVLNGVSIQSGNSAAIYVKQADKVFITLSESSENTLSNGGEFAELFEDNVDAVIFSKDDLTLNGSGSLTVQSPGGHAVVSKDDLKITDGIYEIEALKKGFCGKDCLNIAGGTFTVNAEDDAFHSDADLTINAGTFEISTGDDGMHADADTTVNGGLIHILTCYEGIEGANVTIHGGTIDLTSSDDGINAAGGSDEAGGFRGGFSGGTDHCITINGGLIHVNASGDGLDSNGSLAINGGEIYVAGPTSSMDGALDFDGDGSITGGIVVAYGAVGMAQNFGSNSTQCAILVNVSGSEGDEIVLKDADGTEILSCTAEKAFGCVVISCPDIKEGNTYTVCAGNSSQEVTMDSIIYGNSGGMGGGFGHGGFPGGKGDFSGGDGTFKGGRGQMPGDGETPPGMPSGGQMPENGEAS